MIEWSIVVVDYCPQCIFNKVPPGCGTKAAAAAAVSLLLLVTFLHDDLIEMHACMPACIPCFAASKYYITMLALFLLVGDTTRKWSSSGDDDVAIIIVVVAGSTAQPVAPAV